MKEKIFVLLDELVSMSGSEYTTESLNLELDELNKKINGLKSLIKKTKENMNDSKYLDLSAQMMDRNIEITLKQRIGNLEDSINDIETNIDASVEKEKNNSAMLEKLETEITETKKLIEAFNNKKRNTLDTMVSATYETLLSEYKKKLKEKENSLNESLKEKDNIGNEIEYLSTTNQELLNKLSSTKEKLEETQETLKNEKNYFDYNSKKMDEKNLGNLEKELKEYENQKLTILTDPANLANEAKNLIVQENWNNAISKIKELITVLKTIPYINETDSKFLTKKANELKANIEDKRSEINAKTYETRENDVLTSRIAYLTDLNDNLQDKIKTIEEITADIDNKMVLDLKNEIDNTENNRMVVENNLQDLEKLTDNKDNVDLLATIMAYRKELSSIDKVLASQNNDLESLVDFSLSLEDLGITKLKEHEKANTATIKDLEKELSLKIKFKDEKTKLQDQNDLDQMEKELKLITNSLKYNKTPDEIYQDIDVIMASIDFDEPVRRTRTQHMNVVVPKLNEIKPEVKKDNNIKNNNDGRIKVVEIIPVNPIKNNKEEVPQINTNSKDIGFDELADYIGGNK